MTRPTVKRVHLIETWSLAEARCGTKFTHDSMATRSYPEVTCVRCRVWARRRFEASKGGG